jgi:hypothetical protein
MLPGESDLFIGDGKRDVKVVTVRRAAVLVVSTALAACSGSENSTTDSAAGNVGAPAAAVDTGMNNAATPVAGGTEEITPTDAKSVEHATEYKLTEQNFRQFLAASDSLVALRRRDPAVRALFDKEVSDAGGQHPGRDDERRSQAARGQRRHRPGDRVHRHVGEGLLRRIDRRRSGERFMGNPKSAPPTPALPDNAAFLQKHQGG